MSEAKDIALNQYLTLTLGEELFALGISSVREILDEMDITSIPQTPAYMRGVLNVRGHAVPVIDLRLKFGMSRTETTVNTCVIITEVSLGSEMATMGMLADSVQEVVEFGPDEINPPPQMGAAIDVRFIKGISKKDNRFVMILDIDRVFSAEELGAVAATVAGEAEAV
jgi:purine-binding chemotaxis protein CheW